MPYQVVLIQPPQPNHYKRNFFPRKFKYQHDAQELVKEVQTQGGHAEIRKIEK